ncbi:hypothetical protein [Staphylococcus carnosus]|nr:hypothetical protein [Staphylococcus carnosus]
MEKVTKKDCLIGFSIVGGLWIYGIIDLFIFIGLAYSKKLL